MDAGAIAGDVQGTVVNSSSAGVIHTGTGGNVGGLVGYANGTPIIKSSSAVTIDGSLCAELCQLGGLVGKQDASITYSYATGSVTGAGLNSYDGGLVGEGDGVGTISHSYATGNVSISTGGGQIGGLVGENYSAIDESHATGSVSVSGTAFVNPGGLVGENLGAITNSYATGAVSYTSTAVSSSAVGGLVGQIDYGGTVTHSYATGSVTATNDNAQVGGLAGYADANITTSYALGNVSATGTATQVGGLVGYTDANITVSYAMGNVTGGTYASAGGLVGYLDYPGSAIDTYAHGSVTAANNSRIAGLVGDFEGNYINNSYATGFVHSTGSGSAVAGLIGVNDGTGVNNNYFDYQSAGTSTDFGGATPEMTSTLQNGTLPGGFNGSNMVWIAPAGVYPYFGGPVGGWQGPLVTISGTAYNGASLIPSAGVKAAANGYIFASVTTNSGGFYSISEPQNMLTGGVLTFLTNNGTANTFSDGAGTNGFTGMDLHTGTVSLLNNLSTTLSSLNAAAANALGVNTGSHLLFTVPGGQLSLNNGINLSIASAAPSFTVDQPLTTTGNILINSTGGNLTIAAASPITSGTGDSITLNTAGVFANNAGGSALSTGGGTWQVYSQNPANDNTGGLGEDYIQYNATYGTTTPAQSGNGFLYTLAPVLTPSLSGTVSKTYDGGTSATVSAQNVSVTGAIQGDTVSVTTGSGSFASPNANTGIAVSVPLSGVTAFNGEIPVYGYQLATPSATANIGTINQATLTYTANGATQTYGSSNGTYTGTVTGFVNNETLATATSGTLLFTSPAQVTSNVGTYAINGSGLTATNYVFVQAAANASALTVNPATLFYTANSGATRLYGSANPTFTGSITGFLNSDTLSTVTSGAALFTSPATATSSVGTYGIYGSGLSLLNGNYILAQAPGNTTALTINPATLYYTANSGFTRLYGSANPTFTGSVTGFLNGDTLSTVTSGAALFTSPATVTSNVGTYGIYGSGLRLLNGNYILAQAPGNSTALTINPATLIYVANPVSVAYGSPIPAFTGTVTGFVNNQTLATATTGSLVFSSPATPSSTGSYPVYGSGLTALYGNYIFTQAAGNLGALTLTTPTVVTPTNTTPTFALNNAAILENQALPAFLATYVGPSITGLNLSSILSGFTYQITPSLSGAGTYQITATGPALSGYTLNILPATLTVIDDTPKTLPSQAFLMPPLLPVTLPAAGSSQTSQLFQPVNSLGQFHTAVAVTGSALGSLPQAPSASSNALSQFSFFGGANDHKATYNAGVKP